MRTMQACGKRGKICQSKIMDYSKEEYNAALEEWSEIQEIIPTFSKGEQEHEESIFKETPLIPVDLFIEDFRNSIDLVFYSTL